MIEVDGKKMQWSEGMTIASVLEQVEDSRFCSVVRLNGRLVSSPRFLETRVPDSSILQLLPLVAGG
ncbi:MAG: MoaD/ThiS family protein [Proteobacteria bacterium]|nr:sulfur carrier protein ThiS [Desulfobacula sp.]MBU4132914.1 MoaD/ThiS family protein [Pseudomonadota bacterium]